MAAISIIVGSVYGGAKLVAEELQSALQDLQHTVVLLEQPRGSDLQSDDIDMLLVCTSTTGAGDLPDDLAPLYADLTDAPPNIVGLKYAVIALGDSSYGDTFCGGGLSLDHALKDIGATPVAEPLKLDAMETVTPEDEAVPWGVDLVQQTFA
ncbi:MAG: flavodoxin domain-containing protein [Gammaproteobacteria bacterium]|nr:flavodoxin domain-containing protein [Gammaproteobacteria bacterium]